MRQSDMLPVEVKAKLSGSTRGQGSEPVASQVKE